MIVGEARERSISATLFESKLVTSALLPSGLTATRSGRRPTLPTTGASTELVTVSIRSTASVPPKPAATSRRFRDGTTARPRGERSSKISVTGLPEATSITEIESPRLLATYAMADSAAGAVRAQTRVADTTSAAPQISAARMALD